MSPQSADTEFSPELKKEILSISTPPEQEKEFSVKRTELLNRLAPFLEINASLTGFCNLPEAEVRLELEPSKEHTLYRKQYKVPQALMGDVDEIVDRWYAEGKTTDAPPGCRYNNALTPAPKYNEQGEVTGTRVCLDVRPINNALIISDKFSLPHVKSALEPLYNNSILSEFDLAEAFLQLPLHPDSRPLTAFTWRGRQYMFVGCPFGLSFITAHFQRLMSRVFADFPFCSTYVDNILFGSKDWETHLEYATLIVNRLNQVNLRLKPNWDKVGHAQLKVLGYVINGNGVSIDPKKMQTIRDWPLPTTGSEMASFLGLCGFLRQHIRHYAELTAPLEEVKQQKDIQPTRVIMESFETLKQAVLSAPILVFPSFERPFHIATDASQTGVGGVLFQPADENENVTPTNIVDICSKKLQPHQQRWSAYKKELFAVVYSLRKFHTYVWGRNDLVVHTDHKPLTYIFSSTQLSPPLQQWLDVLLDYVFVIKHRDGILNVLPDHLSRMFGSAYVQSPVWGVDGHLQTGPIPDSSQMGEGSALAATTNARSTSIPSGNHHAAAVGVTSNEINLQVELEKRGKKCPSDPGQRKKLIEDAHLFGHFGREAVFKRLWHQGYWWPNMRTEIESLLKECDPCTRYTVVKCGYHPAGSITANGPGDHFQVDTSVHLPLSPDGYKALLVCID
ncbi:MAG: RNase H-like domain-containing protein, partial [Rhabdochlamydiaceae bacterium]